MGGYIIFGLLAAYLLYTWLSSSQEEGLKNLEKHNNIYIECIDLQNQIISNLKQYDNIASFYTYPNDLLADGSHDFLKLKKILEFRHKHLLAISYLEGTPNNSNSKKLQTIKSTIDNLHHQLNNLLAQYRNEYGVGFKKIS